MTSVGQRLFLLKKIPGKERIGLPSGASRKDHLRVDEDVEGESPVLPGAPKFDLSRMLGLCLWGMGV
jgi:hypothetical protein